MKYTIEDITLIAIADSIRAKTGGADGIMPENMPTEIEGIETGGGTEEIENIIDESGVLESTDGTVTERVDELILYADIARKTMENRKGEIEIMPYFDYSSYTSFRFKFDSYTELTRFLQPINSDNVTNLESAFKYCRKLEEVTLTSTSKVTIAAACFLNCVSLKTVGELDLSSCTVGLGNMLQGCSALENISFVTESIKASIAFPSPVLSAESIQSIIDGLATVETAQTLTLHADVKAKLTEEQLATITSKNWNLA